MSTEWVMQSFRNLRSKRVFMNSLQKGLHGNTTPLMNAHKQQLIKFASVGAINTAVDFLLFALLYNVFNAPLLLANTTSTGTALVTGFFLNARYTFRHSRKSKRIFVLYVAVTLIGLWVLQPVIIITLTPLLLTYLGEYLNQDSAVLAAKALSIVFSMVWNYAWYSSVIFKAREK